MGVRRTARPGPGRSTGSSAATGPPTRARPRRPTAGSTVLATTSTSRQGVGREGWADHAPYDAASLACAADAVPEPVVEQARPGGRLLAPACDCPAQELVPATRREDGSLDHESHGAVGFVEMRGD